MSSYNHSEEQQLIDVLTNLGYYRALSGELGIFDKILEGFAWCVISISLLGDNNDLSHDQQQLSSNNAPWMSDLLLDYSQNAPLGHKIALSEVVVDCLRDEHFLADRLSVYLPAYVTELEPHQIQGLDLPAITKVFSFLLESIQNARNRGADALSGGLNHSAFEFWKSKALEYYVKSTEEDESQIAFNLIPLMVEIDQLEDELNQLKRHSPQSSLVSNLAPVDTHYDSEEVQQIASLMYSQEQVNQQLHQVQETWKDSLQMKQDQIQQTEIQIQDLRAAKQQKAQLVNEIRDGEQRVVTINSEISHKREELATWMEEIQILRKSMPSDAEWTAFVKRLQSLYSILSKATDGIKDKYCILNSIQDQISITKRELASFKNVMQAFNLDQPDRSRNVYPQISRKNQDVILNSLYDYLLSVKQQDEKLTARVNQLDQELEPLRLRYDVFQEKKKQIVELVKYFDGLVRQ
ncbi:hypothetical protein MP228_012585 [Amoeboaphelidium protococcarum]|nr:hypothetical protein MP228_012585 [Amoeboaphelidium protococcarum]